MRKKFKTNPQKSQKNDSVHKQSQRDRDVIVRLLAKLLVKNWLKGYQK